MGAIFYKVKVDRRTELNELCFRVFLTTLKTSIASFVVHQVLPKVRLHYEI